MSWSKDVTIWCDHEDCAPEWIMSDALAPRTLAAARSHAEKAGWRRIDGKDFCPEHVPTGKDET